MLYYRQMKWAWSWSHRWLILQNGKTIWFHNRTQPLLQFRPFILNKDTFWKSVLSWCPDCAKSGAVSDGFLCGRAARRSWTNLISANQFTNLHPCLWSKRGPQSVRQTRLGRANPAKTIIAVPHSSESKRERDVSFPFSRGSRSISSRKRLSGDEGTVCEAGFPVQWAIDFYWIIQSVHILYRDTGEKSHRSKAAFVSRIRDMRKCKNYSDTILFLLGQKTSSVFSHASKFKYTHRSEVTGQSMWADWKQGGFGMGRILLEHFPDNWREIYIYILWFCSSAKKDAP